MSRFLRRQRWAALALALAVFAACAKVNYKLPDEFLSDGDLLAAAMEEAAAKFGENPFLKPDNGPFILKSLVEDDEHKLLYDRFEDALAAEMAARGVAAAASDAEEGAVISYRLIESRIVNAKAEGGRVRRVGRAVAHIRIYGAEGEDLFWAGEYEGEFENVVPKNVVSKLTDERITQIGPQAPEGGRNPFIEPLLVTGITGALIYLFAVSASE